MQFHPSNGDAKSGSGALRSREGPLGRVRTAAALLVGILILGSAPLAASESTARIPRGLETGSLASCEVLLGELGCASCHAAGSGSERIFPRRAPVLGEVGRRATARWLHDFILDPQSRKPGTAMPALVAGLPESERDDAATDLVHFFKSRTRGSNDPVEGDLYEVELGRRLYHSVGCVVCHGPEETLEELAQPLDLDSREAVSEADNATVFAVLGDLARKMSVVELASFLRDPLRSRPSGRMPAMKLSERESRAIAMYLLRGQFAAALGGDSEHVRVPGLRYRYYERDFRRIVEEIESAEPKTSGIAPSFTLDLPHRGDGFGFQFAGLLRIEQPGEYRFWLRSDDGSALWIGEKLVIDNDGVHSPVEKDGALHLDPGEHPVRVVYYELGGGEDLRLEWQGPGIDRADVPPNVLFHLGVPMRPLQGDEEFVADDARATRGEKLFRGLGCAACHTLSPDEEPAPPAAPPLSQVDLDASDGCLSAAPGRGVPRFAFSSELRARVRSALASFRMRTVALTSAERVSRALAVFDCYGCHAREGRGGPGLETSPWFRSAVGETMGIEGATPPPLDGAGRKLRPEWLREVLVHGGAVRPYLLTRMPQFGAQNVEFLVDTFRAVDRPSSAESTPDRPRLVRAGQRLLGTQGMSCISCHRFNGYESLGIPALDLVTTARRIEKDWFRSYLLDPQAWRPGTRMPQFFPDGESARPDILDGDVEAQIEAIWAHLERGPRAPLPHGLKTAGMEIVASEAPVIYRHWLSGVGPRAIAVGYPERLNLAFDAEKVRLALLWQDGFIDAEQHRTGRGAGMIAPLGTSVISWPTGPEIAILADETSPWPNRTGKDAGFRFRGYELDDARRPSFLYELGSVAVEDRFVDRAGEVLPFFERTLILSTDRPPEGLYFRAGRGRAITAEKDAFVVDGTLRLQFRELPPGASPIVRDAGGGEELLVPLAFESGVARIVEEINW